MAFTVYFNALLWHGHNVEASFMQQCLAQTCIKNNNNDSLMFHPVSDGDEDNFSPFFYLLAS